MSWKRNSAAKCYHRGMSRGAGKVEQRIGELFAVTKDTPYRSVI